MCTHILIMKITTIFLGYINNFLASIEDVKMSVIMLRG